ncbi:MAG: DUF1972 domain-containing protein [Eubacterium sp.]|nr:DUF1972 domain-containing protein [Eubacterium sp.]
MQHIFIIGSKGIPGRYGGYETFVDRLTEYHQNNENFKYHVACKNADEPEFEYHNAHCFSIKAGKMYGAEAVLYDVEALRYCCKYIKKHKIQNPIVYILTCRIGPFIGYYYKKIHKLGGCVYLNPDGHEWARAKWSRPVRRYWRMSEKAMVRRADLVICDSKNIEKYIRETYAKYSPKTTYIAYGAETRKSVLSDKDEKLVKWYGEHGLKKKDYYLVVGRFVPENNYETMLKEFIKSKTSKSFALITDVSDGFLKELDEKTGFSRDKRIKFVGTVYDKELLMKIRENAYGYFHGHEVGGTNPSLLEALGSTNLILLLDVGFNRECGEDGVLYWTKEEGSLAALIEKADKMTEKEITALGKIAHKRIANHL